MKGIISFALGLLPIALLAQQSKDTLKTTLLKEVTVNSIKTVRGIGHMPETKDGIIYSGKKIR